MIIREESLLHAMIRTSPFIQPKLCHSAQKAEFLKQISL